MKHTPHSIQAGDFEAKCLQLMDEVQAKHISIVITKHGKPVAKLVPVDDTPVNYFGCMKDTVTVRQDIVASIDADWEANI